MKIRYEERKAQIECGGTFLGGFVTCVILFDVAFAACGPTVHTEYTPSFKRQ